MNNWLMSTGFRTHRLALCLVLVLLLALTAAGCSQLGSSSLIPRPAEAGQLNDDAVYASNSFGVSLYRQLLADEGEANRFISPFSISLALSMTYHGAAGETAAEMAQALQLGDLNPATLKASHAALIHLLARDGSGVELAIANSLWGRQGTEFAAEFLQTNDAFYAAALEEIDPGDPAALDLINGWVDAQTGGHIEEMLDELPANLVLLLLNAIYFQGDWSAPFAVGQTRDAPFHNLDGTTRQVPLMSERGDFAHLETDDLQVVRLPYGDAEAMAMYVFLPSQALGIAGFHDALTHERLRAWMDDVEDGEIMLALPRFEFEYEAQLNDALQAMGMVRAFDGGAADFSGIIEGGGIWVDEVQHKTFIQVNEEGTEAAAATSVAMVDSAPAFNMRVDRPFFFLIHDTESDAILFMGSVVALGT